MVKNDDLIDLNQTITYLQLSFTESVINRNTPVYSGSQFLCCYHGKCTLHHFHPHLQMGLLQRHLSEVKRVTTLAL